MQGANRIWLIVAIVALVVVIAAAAELGSYEANQPDSSNSPRTSQVNSLDNGTGNSSANQTPPATQQVTETEAPTQEMTSTEETTP